MLHSPSNVDKTKPIKRAMLKEFENMFLERGSIQCRESETKVMSLANHKCHRQSDGPIKLEVNACS